MNNAALLLDCLAAGYRFDLDADAFVRNLAAHAEPLMDRGLGVLVYTYDARDPSNASIDSLATSRAFDPGWLQAFYGALAEMGKVADPARPLGFEAWGTMTCGQATEVRGMHPYLPAFTRIGGARDLFAVNAIDASGRGLWLGAPMRSTVLVGRRARGLYSRFASHLAAAMRMRPTSAPPASAPVAVMSTDGLLLHTESSRAVDLRTELRRAALAFERAHRPEARDDVERTTRRWRPLVDATWSLLDECDTDGRRFIVAVENAPKARTPRGPLSAREHQVLTQARLGHTNKVIAYELGLSGATVRVLMHRAARKFGTTSRAETLAAFAAQAEPTER